MSYSYLYRHNPDQSALHNGILSDMNECRRYLERVLKYQEEYPEYMPLGELREVVERINQVIPKKRRAA